MAGKNIKKYSLNEIENMITGGNYVPTKKDAPEYTIDPQFWDDAKLVTPATKKSVHLRLDEDVWQWFKSQGPEHLTRMQTVLRSFYEAQQSK